VTVPTTPGDNFLGVETENILGVTVLRFHNAKILSDRSVFEMGDRLLACLESIEDPPRVAISFKGVNFLSSAGIGKLILVLRKIKERGGELMLCDLDPATLDVFRVAHLLDFFKIYPDLDAALASRS
jgi:anti-anti-sigma factor